MSFFSVLIKLVFVKSKFLDGISFILVFFIFGRSVVVISYVRGYG